MDVSSIPSLLVRQLVTSIIFLRGKLALNNGEQRYGIKKVALDVAVKCCVVSIFLSKKAASLVVSEVPPATADRYRQPCRVIEHPQRRWIKLQLGFEIQSTKIQQPFKKVTASSRIGSKVEFSF